MSKKTKSYWKGRQEQWINNLNKDDEKFTKNLEKYYNSTSQEIEKDIASYFQRYGKDDVIEYRTLMKDLSEKDKNLLYQNMELFAEKYPEYEHLLPVRESIYKLNRLEGLHYSTQMNLLELGVIEQREFEKYLSNVYGKNYKVLFDELGLGEQFLSINDSIINDVIYTKWVDNGNFSDRIWTNKDKLLNHLTTNYRDQIVRGDNYDKMSKMIVDRFGVAHNDAKRLVWTESSFVLNQAHAKPYIDVGLVEYELNAILDGKTSVICRELDKRAKAGESFRFDEMVVGINFPPFHSWCRTTFIGKNLENILNKRRK